ncbi:DEAD/DEAH box helicase [Glutamicibacter creatinolyticus]|uniref:DEAD/DEAH box helicase n=1 Tax=Glutamicibacter creatinolyticus TaxID=162496 RepID=UPI0031D45455
MSELLPTVRARDFQRGLSDYLATTFALTDGTAQAAMKDFLGHPEDGLFKGPYVRLRLPFEPAQACWRDSLDWYEGFDPYGHQARAFARLTSKAAGGGMRRPQPSLVTTGTGSGKTEAFLYPILDHVLRAKKNGVIGTKALILYPMNALANDQSNRLAKMLTSHPALSGVTAGIYTGQQETARTRVSAEGLINDRDVFRADPPDILLTNYKMLDMLLLRPQDALIWKKSATSLQYVVLDEFHTYDGAQGTDVAMLLRRLGLTLKSHWPEELDDHPVLGEEDRERPLGLVTPVATSATLGSKGDPDAMLEFAATVFGEEFDASAVITETRLSAETWCGTGVEADHYTLEDIAALLSDFGPRIREAYDVSPVDAEDDNQQTLAPGLVQVVAGMLFRETPADLALALRRHPLTAVILKHTGEAISVEVLAARIFGRQLRLGDATLTDATDYLTAVLALFSHVRANGGRSELTVETHLWIREMSRVDAAVDPTPRFRWSDDGVDQSEDTFFPALYCRHCGRNGWAVLLAPTGTDLELDDSKIRTARLAKNGRFRALISAANEADMLEYGKDGASEVQGLHWLHTVNRTLSKQTPSEDDPDLSRGLIMPVLMLDGPEADDQSTNDTCPSCLAKEGIAFIGSAVATMLSVTISDLFGAESLDTGEKKALVFTDSVQDAAHRAGFVQSRSHTMLLRTALRRALDSGPATLAELVDTVISTAGTPEERFQLIAPEFVDRDLFKPFWDPQADPQAQLRARRAVKKRLLFDAALEFGLQSRTGRTLELTGSVVVETDAGSTARTTSLARRAFEQAQQQMALETFAPSDRQLAQWVRGTLERVRTRGGIQHPWLGKYIQTDGKRYQIWGGRAKHEGMPAFPTGRSAPAFPRLGKAEAGPENLDPVASAGSWYARWTERTLQVSRAESGYLAKALIQALVDDGVLGSSTTGSGANVYWLDPEKIVLSTPQVQDVVSGQHVLACDTCKAITPGSSMVVDQLESGPCLLVRCSGTLKRHRGEDRNYYRDLYASKQTKRVVAREHTSLLDVEKRLQYEREFRDGAKNPDAPNVLVATPTLEMGIDIGDLSCVMLASLPTSVSSYLQRVGRAGRLTGNSLVLAFVRGRGEHLPKLHDPLSVINGEVRPPATFLDAEEILQRQYVAHLVDRFARDTSRPHPKDAVQALGKVEPGTFIGDLIQDATEHSAEYLEGFCAQFAGHLSAESCERLAKWASEGPEGEPSGLARHVVRAAQLWNADVAELSERRQQIEQALPELEEAIARTQQLGDDDRDDQQALRTAKATLGMLRGQLKELRGGYWISVLEAYGILPNYTLLDDSVTLDVGLSWKDADTNEFQTDALSYERGASVALAELAPGATFYAQGMEVLIDAVDLGPQNSQVQQWQLCPQCGWAKTDLATGSAVLTCVRCGSAGIADMSQVLDVVVMKKVSAEVRRDEASIGDRRENRVRERFSIVAAADIDPQHVQRSWFLEGYDFGAQYLNRVEIRWINVGKQAAFGTTRTIAGDEIKTPLFRVCAHCGQLDQSAKENSPTEHRFWCKYRKAEEENVKEVALARTLSTQGVVLHLPLDATLGDDFSVPSLQAAILLGLQKVLGGAPDHLAVIRISDQTIHQGRLALLLHDKVPGGTGYLARFGDPQRVWELLEAAWRTVSQCSCQHEERLACHNCLLPFADPWTVDHTARATAERLLGKILRAGRSDEPEAGPSFATNWTVTQEVPRATATVESLLEQRFRQAFVTRLKDSGAHYKIVPGTEADTINFRIPGQSYTWQLLPQVDLQGTRPDFLLIAPDPDIPDLAIYTDGYQFHASPEHNRLADDAAKRESLREQGIIPWAVTWQDVEAFSNPDSSGETPIWVDAQLNLKLQASFSPSASLMALISRDAMTQLWHWIHEPNAQEWGKFSDLVPFMLRTSGAGKTDPDAVSQLAQALARREQPELPVGEAMYWTRSLGFVAFACAAPGKSPATFAVGLSLDDRDLAVADAGFGESWREWLRLSNLMAFKTVGLSITTVCQDIVGGSSLEQQTVRKGHVALPVGWESLLAEALEDERVLLVELAQAGIGTPPELGLESASGYVLSLGWSEHRIGVLLEEDSEAQIAWEAEGWQILGPDAAAITAALNKAAPVGGHEGVPPGTSNLAAARLTTEWASLLQDALDDERALITELAAAGVQSLPEVGAEIGDGYPMMLVWEQQRIAVLYDGDDAPQDLAADGWTFVGPQARLIVESLNRKGL